MVILIFYLASNIANLEDVISRKRLSKDQKGGMKGGKILLQPYNRFFQKKNIEIQIFRILFRI